MCYGDPMFRHNPSLGTSGGPKGGTKECRYLHFQVVPTTQRHAENPGYIPTLPPVITDALSEGVPESGESFAQWINCDVRSFDYSILGQYVWAQPL